MRWRTERQRSAAARANGGGGGAAVTATGAEQKRHTQRNSNRKRWQIPLVSHCAVRCYCHLDRAHGDGNSDGGTGRARTTVCARAAAAATAAGGPVAASAVQPSPSCTSHPTPPKCHPPRSASFQSGSESVPFAGPLFVSPSRHLELTAALRDVVTAACANSRGSDVQRRTGPCLFCSSRPRVWCSRCS